MEAEIEYRVANVIGWVFPPFIMAVGTFGNVMSIVIVRRCLRPSALRVFFIALAGADLIMLYNGLLMRWLGFTFHVHVHILHDIICKVISSISPVQGSRGGRMAERWTFNARVVSSHPGWGQIFVLAFFIVAPVFDITRM
nr:hypothetical protein BaRGS_029859 [Batillaria attramentaria]